MASHYLTPGQFAVIAHRGGALESPENTLEAFSRAHTIYPHVYFELDVHPTKDGKIVVIHDDSIDRTTNGSGNIESLTWDEIRTFDAGYRWTADGGKSFPFRNQNCGIPLLEEVLKSFPKARVSIELKPGNSFFGQGVIDVIKSTGAQERVCLAGEDHVSLVRTVALAPDLCSGYSKRELYLNFIWSKYHVPFLGPNRGQVLQIPYEHNGMKVATPEFIRRAHYRGKYVHVWTVNDDATMHQLINMGADGIITDAPTLLLKVARELKKI